MIIRTKHIATQSEATEKRHCLNKARTHEFCYASNGDSKSPALILEESKELSLQARTREIAIILGNTVKRIRGVGHI